MIFFFPSPFFHASLQTCVLGATVRSCSQKRGRVNNLSLFTPFFLLSPPPPFPLFFFSPDPDRTVVAEHGRLGVILPTGSPPTRHPAFLQGPVVRRSLVSLFDFEFFPPFFFSFLFLFPPSRMEVCLPYPRRFGREVIGYQFAFFIHNPDESPRRATIRTVAPLPFFFPPPPPPPPFPSPCSGHAVTPR